jgi:hypothetical protein
MKTGPNDVSGIVWACNTPRLRMTTKKVTNGWDDIVGMAQDMSNDVSWTSWTFGTFFFFICFFYD